MTIARRLSVTALVALAACREAPRGAEAARPAARAEYEVACDTAAAILARLGGPGVERETLDLATYVGDAHRAACSAQFAGVARIGDGLDDSVLARWQGAGWQEAPFYHADGESGDLTGWVRGTALCLVRRAWTLEESAPGEVRRPDSLEVDVTCAERLPADTAGP